MNMMTPTGGVTLTEALIHAGYILTGLAFLLRDILWLRLLAIAANLAVGLAAYRAGMNPQWVVVAWAATFVAINLGHSLWLIHERYLQRLSDEEQRLYDRCFRALDRVAARKLLRRGKWTDFAEKDYLVRQGVHVERLLLLAEGEASVLLGGRVLARLVPGKFIGEVGYLSGEPATATVIAKTPARCVVWRKDELERLLERRPDLLNVFRAAVGQDLAAKVAAHNVSLSEV